MGIRGRKPIYRTHRLAQWLEINKRTRADFAREVGCSGERISAICRGKGVSGDLARKIVAATAGAVTFHDLFSEAQGDAA